MRNIGVISVGVVVESVHQKLTVHHRRTSVHPRFLHPLMPDFLPPSFRSWNKIHVAMMVWYMKKSYEKHL